MDRKIHSLSRTEVKKRPQIEACIGDLLRVLEKISTNSNDDKSISFEVDGLSRISSSTFLPIIKYVPRTRLENVFKQIILEYVMRSEKISPQSSWIMLKILHYLFKKNNFISTESDKKIHNIIHTKIQNAKSLMRRPTAATLDNYLNRNFSETVAEIVKETISLAAPAGKISFDYSNIQNCIIDASSRYKFRLNPDPNIMILSGGDWTRNNVVTFSIEGQIEKVSEIDCILALAAETKSPVLINCLGYSPEVISTILLNNKRGTLDVMIATPVKEDDAINDMTDLATCLGSKFYGYQTGPISGMFEKEDFDNFADEIKVTQDMIFVKNLSSQASVLSRIKQIKEKLGESDIQDEYLRGRIQALQSHQVNIRLPESNRQKKYFQVEEIDHALRSAQSILRHGVIWFEDEDLKISKSLFCASSVYIGISLGYELFKHLLSIQGAIVYDR